MASFDDPALDKTIELRGLRFHYRKYPSASSGQAPSQGSGRPIVLLHGVASSSRIWVLVGPLLAERHPVYALDQRGHGESAKPDSGYDFPTVADDAAALIETLGLDRPVVAGHSWGGSVALELAATYPDHVSGLVLVDGGFLELSARPGATWERVEQEMAPPDLTHLTPAELIAAAQRWELGPIWSDAIEAALMGNFEVTEAGTIRPRLSRANHMQVVRAMWEQKLSELYPKVRCPVLFAVAEREGGEGTKLWQQMKREGVERAAKLLPQCEVVWFRDTIHDIPLQRPRELAQTIDEFADKLDG